MCRCQGNKQRLHRATMDDHNVFPKKIMDEDIFQTIKVEEINKRSLSKVIIKYCGNEGNMEEERETSLRKLLQGTVDFLPKEYDYVWKNAEINIYDNDNHAFKIVSGNGDNKFVVQYKGRTDQIDIVNIERQQRYCALL